MSQPAAAEKPSVALLVTCLVDLFRPSVGFSTVELLEQAGCRVEVPPSQTCCGQPAYNSGDRESAKTIARQVIAAFAGFDYVVAPSGSCAGMVRLHYPRLFADDAEYGPRAAELAERCFELTSFLTDVVGVDRLEAAFPGRVTYHDSCSGLRELGIHGQPRRLLASVAGLELSEAEQGEACCGFGGSFAVKYPDISVDMADRKVAAFEATGADTVLGGDLGCLMNLSGRLQRQGSRLSVRHVAEVLAGHSGPAIGEPGEGEGS
ncbi:MAG TPA: (Fe-S)-binding protein [Alphaproteobacteria bacterium]|nr:(Fe-S)-binding protein [Alphaproteobacteria bacterium]